MCFTYHCNELLCSALSNYLPFNKIFIKQFICLKLLNAIYAHCENGMVIDVCEVHTSDSWWDMTCSCRCIHFACSTLMGRATIGLDSFLNCLAHLVAGRSLKKLEILTEILLLFNFISSTLSEF